jgi:hypothetical protein
MKNELKQMVLSQMSELTNRVIEEVRKYQVCMCFLIISLCSCFSSRFETYNSSLLTSDFELELLNELNWIDIE